MQEKPNVLLIVVDEMRGDCIGAAGHPDVKTPYLDTLLSKGVYFPNAYSTCPSCIAARAALHTGLSQKSHGRTGYQDGVPWDYPHTLAGEMAAAGYYTQCVGKMHVHPLRNTLGFHNVILHDGYLHYYRGPAVPYAENQLWADDYFHWLKSEKGIDCDVTDTGLECNSWVSRPWIYEERLHPTNWVTDQSLDFLRRRDPRKPFFLMSSYVRPHAPYDAPEPYFALYRDKALRPPLRGDWDDLDALHRDSRVFNNITGPEDPGLIRQQQIGYYACITHLDHQIGRLIQKLIEDRLMDNTVIIFTSDHGEMLSDHGLVRKSLGYQGSAHIPLMIYGPERLVGRPRRCEELAELRDILPTAVGLTGGTPPVETEGVNLLSEDIHRDYLYGQHDYGEKTSHFIITQTDKYIYYPQTGTEQYFRLDTDPGETHNAVADAAYRQRVSELREILKAEEPGLFC